MAKETSRKGEPKKEGLELKQVKLRMQQTREIGKKKFYSYKL